MGVPREILEEGAKQQIIDSTPKSTRQEAVNTVKMNDQQLKHKLNSDFKELSPEELTFESKDISLTLDQSTGGFKKILLKNYTNELDGETLVNLVDELLVLQPLVGTEAGPVYDFAARRVGDTITFERVSGAFKVTHSYTYDGSGYGLDVNINYENISDSPQNLYASVFMQDGMADIQALDAGFLPGIPTGRPTLVSSTGENSEHHDALSYCEDKDEKGAIESSSAANINVLGLDRHYFVKAILGGGQKFSYSINKSERQGVDSCLYNISMGQNYGRILPGKNVEFNLRSFFGPKDLDILKSYDEKLLDTLDLGWFGFLSQPLLEGIKMLFKMTGNWGLAIILLTVIIKILFYPLTKAAAVAMHKSKKLQPEMMKLRENSRTIRGGSNKN